MYLLFFFLLIDWIEKLNPLGNYFLSESILITKQYFIQNIKIYENFLNVYDHDPNLSFFENNENNVKNQIEMIIQLKPKQYFIPIYNILVLICVIQH